jgi:hypothetical protein
MTIDLRLTPTRELLNVCMLLLAQCEAEVIDEESTEILWLIACELNRRKLEQN